MIKYFIENESGEWLTDPELWFEGQPAFTKDPFKAWMFDESTPGFKEEYWGFNAVAEYVVVHMTQVENVLLGCVVKTQEFQGKWLNGQWGTEPYCHITKFTGGVVNGVTLDENGRVLTYEDGGTFTGNEKGGYNFGVYKPGKL